MTPTAAHSALHSHTHTHTPCRSKEAALCILRASQWRRHCSLRPPTLPAVPSPPSAENDRPQTDLASVLRLCLCALGVRRGQPRSTCSTCAALPSSVNSACRCRAIPVPGGRTTVANCRDEPTTTTPTVTRCVEIAAPSSFHLAHRPPLRVPGGMRAGRWFKLLSAPGKVGLKIMSRATGL